MVERPCRVHPAERLPVRPSEALASWFRALVDAGALSRLLSLRASEKVLYSQGGGYPVKA